jgi:predicted RNase H-related nuclease YkuK (DUF458 family)
MQSITYGEVSIKEIVDIIEKRVNERPYSNFQVVVGTDSQNFDKTKIVLVIALLEETKGGIFFYEITRVKKITNLKNKLYKETQMSLDCATELMQAFEDKYDESGFDYTQIHFSIHVDAGFKGDTREVIPEIVGWVKSCGYEVHIKPESFVASSIADKLSK